MVEYTIISRVVYAFKKSINYRNLEEILIKEQLKELITIQKYLITAYCCVMHSKVMLSSSTCLLPEVVTSKIY